MKQAIGWTLSWACYLAGDAASRVIARLDPQSDWLCRVCYWCYNTPMIASHRLQEWGGKGPWLTYSLTPAE